MNIATGLAVGHAATPDLARQAVAQAMARAQLRIANSVLLFLTPEFARDPRPTLLATAKAGNCTRILGCSAAGIFTEQDWVLDSPAAAAMAFGGKTGLVPCNGVSDQDLVLSLAAPNAINTTWLSEPGMRYGGVSGDATGQGPFKVWCDSKECPNGRFDTRIAGVQGAVEVSPGIRPISTPREVTQVSGYDILTLAEQPALNVLARELPLEVRELERIPLHLIMAGVTFGETATALADGRFRLSPVISTNAEERSVTLSTRLTRGEQLFWALRQPLAAERDMRLTVERLEQRLTGAPDFGLLFSCMGRGPYFYGGVDRDLELVKQRYPGMPLIGFYGNGEIAPLHGVNQLLQYSTVLGLFSGDV